MGYKTSETLLGIETFRISIKSSISAHSYKTSETLLGIETAYKCLVNNSSGLLQNLWNPFRDWNSVINPATNTVVALQNLWNPFRDWNISVNQPYRLSVSYKTSETLLGIETRN